MRRVEKGYLLSALAPRRANSKDLWIPGLIRHYAMERISGSTLYDQCAIGNATIYNMTQSPGVSGVCLAGGSVATITRNIDLGSDITFASFSAWIKRNDISLISGVLFNSGGNKTVQILSSGNYISCYNGSWISSNLVLADTNWHHLAGVLESTNNIRLYLDGVKASLTLAINSSVVRYFGRYSVISGQEACSLDEVRLYSTILTEMQVLKLYDEFR